MYTALQSKNVTEIDNKYAQVSHTAALLLYKKGAIMVFS